MTAGTWSWRKEGTRSIAAFAERQFVLFSVICEPAARQVTLRVAMADTAWLGVTTTDTRRVLTAEFDNTIGPAMAKVVLGAGDPLLDAMAFSRGRFMIETTKGNLYLPSWPEVSRVIEDCRL